MTVNGSTDEQNAELSYSIPNYISEGINRQPVSILHDIALYIEEMIEYINKPPSEGIDGLSDESEELLETTHMDEWTQVQKKVDCGKACSGCPHGPYLYLVKRITSEKLEWKYIGPSSTVAASFPGLLDEEPDNTDEQRTVNKELDSEAKEKLKKINSNKENSSSNKNKDDEPPEKPSAVPNYIIEGIDRQNRDTLDDIIQYVDDVMEKKVQRDDLNTNDELNSTISKKKIPEHDEILQDEWTDEIGIEDCEEGDIVEIIDADAVEYQSAKVTDVSVSNVKVVTENGKQITFDTNGYSNNFDTLNSKYKKDGTDNN